MVARSGLRSEIVREYGRCLMSVKWVNVEYLCGRIVCEMYSYVQRTTSYEYRSRCTRVAFDDVFRFHLEWQYTHARGNAYNYCFRLTPRRVRCCRFLTSVIKTEDAFPHSAVRDAADVF